MNRKMLDVSLFLLVQALACAGDDSSSKGPGDAATVEPGGVACAATKCRPPDGFNGEACCRDGFTGTCGVKTAPDACNLIPPQTEPNCPDGTVIYGDALQFARGCCITDTDECGLNVSPGAIILGLELPINCQTLAAAESLGIGSSTDFTANLPTPTRCDGTPID